MSDDVQTDITALMGTLKALDQWRSAEVTMQSHGAHRRGDGSVYVQVEYLIEVVVPDHEHTKRIMDMIEGLDVVPAETHPVVGSEAMTLW